MNFAQEILEKTNHSAEVYLVKTKTTKIDVLDQKIESMDILEESGCGIRVCKNNKMGFAYTSEFDDFVISETIKQAIANTDKSEKDEFNSLPEPRGLLSGTLSTFDPAISKAPIKDKIEIALKIERTAYGDKRVKKTEKVTYEDSEYEVWIVNSNGVDVYSKGNHCGGAAQIIAQAGKEAEAGFGIDFTTQFSKLDPEKIGNEAAKRATELLGAQTIQSKKMDIILDPTVSTQILGIIAHILSADAVQKGKSLFAEKLNKQIASNIINIIDDGRLKNGLGSSLHDAEGIPTEETELVKDGILQTYLYNTYSANKAKLKSNGKAARASFKGTPGISSTNLYIKPSKTLAIQIINNVTLGLYVTRVMGLHTINPISGDFSIGASGILIKNGKEKHAVRGVTIAGNLIDLLEKIEVIGSDLRFIATLGAPTLLVSDIMVSGH